MAFPINVASWFRTPYVRPYMTEEELDAFFEEVLGPKVFVLFGEIEVPSGR